jgi:Amt family ammonium transporter
MEATSIDRLWVVVAAGLVFLMQAGFLCLEVGFVRRQHATLTAMKNAIDWMTASLAFFAVGFGLMFGPSMHGWIGTDFFALAGIAGAPGGEPYAGVFFLFQLGFVGTAVTIVSGALAERTSFNAYLIASFLIAVLIYPVFGHWAWGGSFVPGAKGWLAELGYVDFAGSSVVHAVGGFVALVGAWVVGPRLGRFDPEGRPRAVEQGAVGMSVLGVLILWLGWWGFNGGSPLRFDASVAGIILNTNLAGAAGGLAAFLHCWFAQGKRGANEKFLGGALGGLVAVTASCHIVRPLDAVAIGAIAGVVHNLAFDWILERLRIDDPVGAIPVHAACGVWGVLAVALFGDAARLEHGRLAQLGVQALGVAACFAWSAGCAYGIFRLLRATIGLRVSPEHERAGYDVAGVSEPEPEAPLDPALVLELLQRSER